VGIIALIACVLAAGTQFPGPPSRSGRGQGEGTKLVRQDELRPTGESRLDWGEAPSPYPLPQGEKAPGADPSMQTAALPLYKASRPDGDWLLDRAKSTAGVYRTERTDEIVLSNGLISRTFRLDPEAATVGFDNLMTGETLIRSVQPEGYVDIDGKRYPIGGLQGQPDMAYLTPKWLDAMRPVEGCFRFAGFEVTKPAERVPWVRARHSSPEAVWPPKGVGLVLHFKGSDGPLSSLEPTSITSCTTGSPSSPSGSHFGTKPVERCGSTRSSPSRSGWSRPSRTSTRRPSGLRDRSR